MLSKVHFKSKHLLIPETSAQGWGLTAKQTNERSKPSPKRLTRPRRAVRAHRSLVQTKRLRRGETGFLRSETREGQRRAIGTGQPGGPRAAPGLAGTQQVKMYFLTKHRKGIPRETIPLISHVSCNQGLTSAEEPRRCSLRVSSAPCGSRGRLRRGLEGPAPPPPAPCSQPKGSSHLTPLMREVAAAERGINRKAWDGSSLGAHSQPDAKAPCGHRNSHTGRGTIVL